MVTTTGCLPPSIRKRVSPRRLFDRNPSRPSLQEMDTSNPAVFVNGELLPMWVGRRVRAVVQVLRTEGGSFLGKSTDDHQLTIKGPIPQHLTTYVEVIGIAESNQSIRGEIFTNFGDNFGTLSHIIDCANLLMVNTGVCSYKLELGGLIGKCGSEWDMRECI
ncbi:hypothetical protein C5167_046850 [Papaver somniferum]|uniref:Uncharacterized protein n=1 Tax=Papaver somniferum TaxID=3469 RepID=A0A4Y7LIQ7_PAPSO|nr:hypothetical protein C5167_046850 [Papaver somniferum]